MLKHRAKRNIGGGRQLKGLIMLSGSDDVRSRGVPKAKGFRDGDLTALVKTNELFPYQKIGWKFQVLVFEV
jgi:hypothetical protein